MPHFGARVRMARAHLNLSQPRLADELEISEGTLRAIEKSPNPPMKGYALDGFLGRITEVCDVPREFFFADFDRLATGQAPDSSALQRIEDKLDRLLDGLQKAAEPEETVTDPQAFLRSLRGVFARLQEIQERSPQAQPEQPSRQEAG